MANHVLDQYGGTLSQKLLQYYRARARPTRARGANYSPRSLHTEPRNFTYMCAVSPETAKRTYGLLPFLSNDTDPMRPYETSGCCLFVGCTESTVQEFNKCSNFSPNLLRDTLIKTSRGGRSRLLVSVVVQHLP